MDEVGELAEEAVGWFVVADEFDAGYPGTANMWGTVSPQGKLKKFIHLIRS
jgi:hypothetical protein